MDSLLALETPAPPRLARAVGLQMLALAGLMMVSALPWRRAGKAAPPRPVEVKKAERQIRIVQLPKPPPAPAASQPQPPRAQPAPPRAAPAQVASPRPPSPIARIAADSTAVQGVRMRVLVPRSPGELAAHLRNSGGCLVVSRLAGGTAEVLSVLSLEGQTAVETSGPPCAGIPRLLRDPALNAALGDPLGRARAASPGDDLVLQVLLSPTLHQTAETALRARFGAVSQEEMGRLAAESGYELTCFAEPEGPLRCD
ncbi:MAG TPA: hypothetical protein VFA79_16135 [Myxococcales bacterium]|nr:hypothetical protein [Myxococcales bacterium]